MTRDELEFSISQYLDGTLDGADRDALKVRLETDEEARDLLAEYQNLEAALKTTLPEPQVNWDRFATHLSSAVANADTSADSVTYRIGFGWRSIAIAASLLIVMGLAILLARPHGQVITTRPVATAVVQVQGPTYEAATQPAVAVVTVGPASASDDNRYQLSEGIVYRPPHVSLIASAPPGAQDTERSPYR